MCDDNWRCHVHGLEIIVNNLYILWYDVSCVIIIGGAMFMDLK